jgi:hypothetical protein
LFALIVCSWGFSQPRSCFHVQPCHARRAPLIPPFWMGFSLPSRAGADVVLADLPDRQAELAAVAAKVEDLGRTATAVPIDVRNKEAVDAAMAHVAT